MTTKSLISRAMAELGRRTSDAKAAAARENGRKGGRPKKPAAKPAVKTKGPKRRVKQNVWGNWYGYEGTRRVREFSLISKDQEIKDFLEGKNE